VQLLKIKQQQDIGLARNGRLKMAKRISWTYGGKRYYGTFIRETKTHKFARTASGKIKKIKKGK